MQVDSLREQFPALAKKVGGHPAVFLDGPAGSQVPKSVMTAIQDYFVNHNANHGGAFATSRESDAVVDEAREAVADLLGVPDSDCVVFGANMTTLTFAFSRAISTQWQVGDEIMVTRLDHDANVSPWVRAAQDRGVTVQHVAIHKEDCTLDLEDYRSKLSSKTRLVAFGGASNAVGSRNPIAEMVQLARQAGALTYIDAVHLAPHSLLDIPAWGCDFLACSAYKFFGPHVGIVWGRRDLLETLPAYKVRPSPETLPDRWMTGTQNFECIAGVGAAVEYLASLGTGATRREQLRSAFNWIETYERELGAKLIAGLCDIPSLKVYGIVDPKRYEQRVPTISFTHRRHSPKEIAEFLAAQGIFVWHGNYYALPLTETLGVEPAGMVRVGLLHYNTPFEVDRLLHALQILN